MPNTSDGIEAVINYLHQLSSERFFGTVELRLQSGGIVQVLTHCSYKTHELPIVRPERRYGKIVKQ
jgi:hypothetical protein